MTEAAPKTQLVWLGLVVSGVFTGLCSIFAEDHKKVVLVATDMPLGGHAWPNLMRHKRKQRRPNYSGRGADTV